MRNILGALVLAFPLVTGGSLFAQEASQAAAPPQTQAASSQTQSSDRLIVPTGTRLPLVLHNAVTTRNARPGDPVYLETLFPVVIKDRILIPAGTYVQGEIQEAKRPGKVKRPGEIRMRLNSMILPNGYTVDFNAVPIMGSQRAAPKEQESARRWDSPRFSSRTALNWSCREARPLMSSLTARSIWIRVA